jgi:2-aminoethylphosphonate-pyruvate transaminase
MCHDIGAWDAPLQTLVKRIREGLLEIANVGGGDDWDCVLMQGSGSFGVESAIGSLSPHEGRLAVVSNGAYGERMITIARMLGVDVVPIRFAENEPASAEVVADVLAAGPDIHTVGIIHCETTTGLLNNIESIGHVVRQAGRRYLVDAMSTFGAYSINLNDVDVLISSANKGIEGVPGFSFILARRDLLEEAGKGRWARSHCMDLYDQWRGFESSGKFRFTPPNQVLLAFRQALREFFAEGGIAARQARYIDNHRTLMRGMDRLGFVPFLPRQMMSHIITTFHCPDDPAYDFQSFYDKLSERGMVIYPGKVTGASCFRIGNIGRLYSSDMDTLLLAIESVVGQMGFDPGRVEQAAASR